MMQSKPIRRRINKGQRFMDNENFKYAMRTNKNNNKDTDAMARIHIKREHRCLLQANKSKVKDAKVLQLIGNEGEVVVNVALGHKAKPNSFFDEGRLLFFLGRSLLRLTDGMDVSTLGVTSSFTSEGVVSTLG